MFTRRDFIDNFTLKVSTLTNNSSNDFRQMHGDMVVYFGNKNDAVVVVVGSPAVG